MQAGAPAPLRLICFSYAGGTQSVYRDWQEQLGGRVKVVPVLLPGRGPRIREPLYTGMRALVGDLTDALQQHRLDSGYAVFGHSMGALVGYEVSCELRRRGAPGPRHFFAAGSRAPHHYGDPAMPLLSDGDLRRQVRELGGLGPDEALGSAYLERRLPVLRADLDICRTYRWTPRKPLGCAMTAISAADDPIAPPGLMEGWREYTAGSFLRRHVPGGHFFLLGPERARLWPELRRELDRLTGTAAGTAAGPPTTGAHPGPPPRKGGRAGMIAQTLVRLLAGHRTGLHAPPPRAPQRVRGKDLAIDLGQRLLEREFLTGPPPPPRDGSPQELVNLAHTIDAVTAAFVIQLGINKLRTGRVSNTGWRGYTEAFARALDSAKPGHRMPSPVALALAYVAASRVPGLRDPAAGEQQQATREPPPF
uniref:Putative thioesterase n=1 Tax=Streptomyces griseoviridis TaxID=45398 RepID=B6VRR0_STRGD|nr:putative thioesterase [Streptomyces griseoviridis]